VARTKDIDAAHAEATLTAGLRHLDRVREVWLVRCVLFAEFLGACLIPSRIFSPFLRKAAGNLKGHTRACALSAAVRANTLPAAALLPPAPSAAAARSAKTKTLRSLRVILGKGDRVELLVSWPGCPSLLSTKPPRLARGIKFPEVAALGDAVGAPIVSVARALFSHFPNQLSPYPVNPNDDVRDAISVDVVDKAGSIRAGVHPLPT